MTFAISKAESFQVIGFNKDNTQMVLFSARSAEKLILGWAEQVKRHNAAGPHNILPTFKKIVVWNSNRGWGTELPYIETISE